MASATNPHGVQPGQTWNDNDRRAKGRLLRVAEVDDEHARTGLAHLSADEAGDGPPIGPPTSVEVALIQV